ncbi:PrsW family intramembrane metalloprotease [Patescibacteria group bacterium]|nr:PrsW family intramembrane metalloprotease [Patescibacteria group bacterium]MBU1016065.1 PrsW family intramembrane metalloprotease [Patescibacteria group bacterium]MBU1685471.1 PrsW family intramembrane metalloprotease [Patescibacteria group bacterium]MBU1938683.1 PrsW family intramembrane metalloprotease [Patescibacteria group bacterium]
MIDPKYIISFVIAIVPALIWSALFLKKHKENKWLVFLTFFGGIFAAQLILLYKGYWDTTINLIFAKVTLVDFRSNISSMFVSTVLAAFVTFLGIGAMEEFFKFGIMKLISKNFFSSIDDVISLAIISALGFSFYENMIYFNSHWGNLSVNSFLMLAVSRVTIVTMVHMLCSGVLGYYFGLAYFASPILRLEHAEKKRHPVLLFFKNLLHMRKSHLYRNEMMTIGLVLAMLLHAIYDFVLSSTINLSPILISGTILLYFFGGYYFLSYLMKRKESKLQLGLLLTEMADD